LALAAKNVHAFYKPHGALLDLSLDRLRPMLFYKIILYRHDNIGYGMNRKLVGIFSSIISGYWAKVAG